MIAEVIGGPVIEAITGAGGNGPFSGMNRPEKGCE